MKIFTFLQLEKSLYIAWACLRSVIFYNNTEPRRADYTAPAHWGIEEIDGLLVPPGKACVMLTIQINKQTPKLVLQY